jgi:hypothetical protein
MRPRVSSADIRRELIRDGKWACERCTRFIECHGLLSKEEARAYAEKYGVMVACRRRQEQVS